MEIHLQPWQRVGKSRQSDGIPLLGPCRERKVDLGGCHLAPAPSTLWNKVIWVCVSFQEKHIQISAPCWGADL